MPHDFTGITENPGDLITQEALQMMIHRYSVALPYTHDKDVLEVGCGPGVGLGYLAMGARRVVGGDLNTDMVWRAQCHYRGRVGVVYLDAQELPFADHSFDVALLYEAIYYLPDASRFLSECRRVLRERGTLIMCSINEAWSDFNPSPFSTTYYSASELFTLLAEHGFQTEIFGAFPAITDSLSRKAVSLIKRTASSLHLIPGSMKGKQWLKRIFYGNLYPVPRELRIDIPIGYSDGLVPLSGVCIAHQYKVLYAIGTLN